MTREEAIKRYKNNAEYERTHGNLQGCLEFRQLAEWLESIDKIRAEIEQKCCLTVGRENDPAITLYDVFEIIDKYKAESEKINCKATKCENCTNHNYCDYEQQESEDKKLRLIDADELVEHAWRDKLDSRELIAQMIENAPTIKEIPTKIPISVFEKLISQEPKTGHWIDNMDLGYHVSICSNCNWRGHGDTYLIYKTNYCPNCGAKMEERKDTE